MQPPDSSAEGNLQHNQWKARCMSSLGTVAEQGLRSILDRKHGDWSKPDAPERPVAVFVHELPRSVTSTS